MQSSSSPFRTLVIDDDEMSRELLTLLLEAESHIVDSAESGDAALNHLRGSHHAYDLILTDLQMPGITGAALAYRLRDTCGPQPLLLAISGSHPPNAEVSPYDGFLLKPFPIEAVTSALTNRESPQSCTSVVTSNVVSLAASGGDDASNQSMTLPAQHNEFLSPPFPCTQFTTPTNHPVLDEQIYSKLASSMPSSQLHEVFTLCINDARSRIAAMRSLVEEDNSAQFIREAHAIKGGSGMLGATELHCMASTLETCGLTPGLHGKAQDVNSLDELCAACDRLERMLGSRV